MNLEVPITEEGLLPVENLEGEEKKQIERRLGWHLDRHFD